MTVRNALLRAAALVLPLFLAVSCTNVDAPDGSTVKIPTVKPPLGRYDGLNEKRDPVTRVRLGRDVLVPQPLKEDVMPDVAVGPYELRGETLASALQLILDDYDVSLAFESNEGLTRRITVSNLHGKLKDVVNRVCSLADLYCHFEDDTLTIKDTERFIVDLPPIGGEDLGSSAVGGSSVSSAYAQIAAGLNAVINTSPTVDVSTRVMIYTATQRSNKYALQYFERLRKNTALIIFETNIWEVTLNSENRTGINWDGLFNNIGNFSVAAVLPGGSGALATAGPGAPFKLTPTYTNGSGNVSSSTVLDFISSRGTVKTISQPQITVLSGSKAAFSVQQKQNFIKSIVTTPCSPTPCTPTTTPETDTVTTGLKMNVTSAWDQSTVYGNLSIALDELLQLQNLSGIQLPQTTTRSLQTQIRVRPGDAILIGGLVSEKSNFSDSGPGFMTPILTTSHAVTKTNTELVFLLRPRVVVFDMGDDSDTPPIVNAPKDGIALKTVPSVPLADNVQGIFKKPPPPKRLPDISSDVGSLFGSAPGKLFPAASDIESIPPPAIVSARSLEKKRGGFNE